MNYVAGTLLLVLLRDEGGDDPSAMDAAAVRRAHRVLVHGEESRVFWLMAALLRNYSLRDLWRPGVPQLRLRVFQMDALLRVLLPELHQHFRAVGVTADMFASHWLLTVRAPHHV